MEFPKSSLLEYDGKTIKIYYSGLRDLTEEEKQIKSNEPKDEKQDEIDMMTDGSCMFYRRKRYYQESGKEYLFGIGKSQGKRLTNEKQKDGLTKDMIEDESIKGEIILVYEVI